MKILILESNDGRVRSFCNKTNDHFVDRAKTVKEGISLLSEGGYDIIFLEHDFGDPHAMWGDPNTGRDVIDWLVAHDQFKQVPIIIHSVNSPAAAGMAEILEQSGFWSVRTIPFTELLDYLPKIL
jgi:hypothetical protein